MTRSHDESLNTPLEGEVDDRSFDRLRLSVTNEETWEGLARRSKEVMPSFQVHGQPGRREEVAESLAPHMAHIS